MRDISKSSFMSMVKRLPKKSGNEKFEINSYMAVYLHILRQVHAGGTVKTTSAASCKYIRVEKA
jgi:hypothetical protein